MSSADGGGALPLHPAEGSALWTPAPARRAAGRCPAPAGAFAPDPEMLTHLCFACGRDGSLEGFYFFRCSVPQPAIMTAGWVGLR